MSKQFYQTLASFIFVGVLFSCGIQSNNQSAESESGAVEEVQETASYDYQAVPENAEFVFLASHDANLDNYKQKVLIMLKNYLEANSNGRLAIKIYPNAQLASSNETMDGIIQGSFDIANTTSVASLYWEPLSIFDLPYMVTDDRLVETVFNDPQFIKDLRDGALAATDNARLMIITNSGRWRNFATVNKQIKNVEDLADLKIRTVLSKVQQQLVSELGASPTGIPWLEVYTSLSTGVVDGTKNGLVDIVATKLHESLKYVILDGHAYMTGFWWVNNEKFMSMPEDLKNIMVDGFDAMSWFMREYSKYEEVSSFEAFKNAGGIIYKPTPAELEGFKEKAKGVESWFKENVTEETIKWLDRYKKEIAKQQLVLESTRALERS